MLREKVKKRNPRKPREPQESQEPRAVVGLSRLVFLSVCANLYQLLFVTISMFNFILNGWQVFHAERARAQW